MRISSILACLSITAAGGAASAQNLTATDWAGQYYGVTLGYSDGDSSHINGGVETGGPGISGGSIGLTYGKNFAAPSGALVYGLEVDAAFLDVSGELPIGSYNGFNCGSGPCITNISWLATLRGRVGVPQGNTLFYGTAGLAVGGVEGTIPNDSSLDIGTQAQVGWTIGVGAEYKLNDRTSIKGDILYTDLGESRYDNDTGGDPFYVDTTFTQVVLGMNFRF